MQSSRRQLLGDDQKARMKHHKTTLAILENDHCHQQEIMYIHQYPTTMTHFLDLLRVNGEICTSLMLTTR